MKKIIVLLSLVAFIAAPSCREVKAPETKKEVIIVPSEPVIIVKDPPPAPKSTTVTFDKNGVKIETKKEN